MAEIKELEKTELKDGIVLTEKAISEVKKIRTENNIGEEFGLRVGVKGGGCSGLSYTLGFDSEIKETDKIIEFGGVKVVVDWKSILYLAGTTVDYTDGLSGKGFVFNNPMAKKTCGCGSSFGV
ncbi:MAG: iron-sulfur cluster insertion protein ErpA [Chlorobi bacterium]|nr:iron-sulfur cluster insertion protein ErpA [Chlorobiota bacterium]MCI0717362.1 iron-sulfur cluster insertion protein ErpA [Chlorobiota bacterium]